MLLLRGHARPRMSRSGASARIGPAPPSAAYKGCTAHQGRLAAAAARLPDSDQIVLPAQGDPREAHVRPPAVAVPAPVRVREQAAVDLRSVVRPSRRAWAAGQ